MQRLSTAYAIGGIETLRTTLAYNFGVLPSRFVLAHPGDFQWLVDDINGIEVTVFQPIPMHAEAFPQGSSRWTALWHCVMPLTVMEWTKSAVCKDSNSSCS